jgi:hypothetical protein
MAENDLLPLDPDYAVAEALQPGVLRQQAQSGLTLQRLLHPSQRLFRLGFRGRSTDEAEQIRDWYARFQHDFFRFQHKVYTHNAGSYLARHFPVIFAAEPEYELAHNDTWNIEVELLEAIGQPLPTANYPDPAAGHPSFFIEEDNVLAQAVVGSWPIAANANAHGTPAQDATNTNTNTTDKFRFLYSGYGFRVWARKGPNLGILKVLVDEVDLGNVDLYNASVQASAALLTKSDLPLGIHRVDIKATNTKNAAATGQTIVADAIEVIP